jgi:hypothetical protein
MKQIFVCAKCKHPNRVNAGRLLAELARGHKKHFTQEQVAAASKRLEAARDVKAKLLAKTKSKGES